MAGAAGSPADRPAALPAMVAGALFPVGWQTGKGLSDSINICRRTIRTPTHLFTQKRNTEYGTYTPQETEVPGTTYLLTYCTCLPVLSARPPRVLPELI